MLGYLVLRRGSPNVRGRKPCGVLRQLEPQDAYEKEACPAMTSDRINELNRRALAQATQARPTQDPAYIAWCRANVLAQGCEGCLPNRPCSCREVVDAADAYEREVSRAGHLARLESDAAFGKQVRALLEAARGRADIEDAHTYAAIVRAHYATLPPTQKERP